MNLVSAPDGWPSSDFLGYPNLVQAETPWSWPLGRFQRSQAFGRAGKLINANQRAGRPGHWSSKNSKAPLLEFHQPGFTSWAWQYPKKRQKVPCLILLDSLDTSEVSAAERTQSVAKPRCLRCWKERSCKSGFTPELWEIPWLIGYEMGDMGEAINQLVLPLWWWMVVEVSHTLMTKGGLEPTKMIQNSRLHKSNRELRRVSKWQTIRDFERDQKQNLVSSSLWEFSRTIFVPPLETRQIAAAGLRLRLGRRFATTPRLKRGRRKKKLRGCLDVGALGSQFPAMTP